ncbi:MAG: DUF4159 domain-containing protein [Paracoccaceae bacterium]
MLTMGALAFLNPWLLAGLVALPLLWWLLRAIPPSPRRQDFAAVRLLLGLEDPEREAQRTPWWLLALRIAAIAAAVLGFAQPVVNPSSHLVTAEGDGPVLVLMDQGWASAPDWEARQAAARAALDEAAEDDRAVIFWPVASGAEAVPPASAAEAMRPLLDGATPRPWAPDRSAVLAALEDGRLPALSQTVWLHDGLGHDGETTEALLAALDAAGPLRLIGPAEPAAALTPARLVEGRLVADVLRVPGPAATLPVLALARGDRSDADADALERRVAVADAVFAEGQSRATVAFNLPPQIVRDVTRIALVDAPTAGGTALATGAIRRVSAGLVAPETRATDISLTSARHYLREALVPWADIREGSLDEMLEAPPAALFLADYGAISGAEREALTEWVEDGGLLVRFAGPRLAAAVSERIGQTADDPLLPVRLRRGGRVLGGALAWSSPRSLGAFDPDGIFRRLELPEDVEIRTQVLAEPSPDLTRRVWAALDDGTPLVTGASLGEGTVVLFHVTADAEWSSIPLSGLFVEMLGRLLALAPGQVRDTPSEEDLAGTLWRADRVLGPDGISGPADGSAAPVTGERIAAHDIGPGMPPGLYVRANNTNLRAGEAGEIVLNLTRADDTLAAFPPPPAGAQVETLGGGETLRFGQWLLVAATLMALADVIATLWISGRLPVPGTRSTAVSLLAFAILTAGTTEPRASDTIAATIEATAETTLGYVLTGDPQIDRISARALVGLGNEMTRRTAVEPGPPMGVDPETSVLALYPVLYWPLTARTMPSEAALGRLAAYLAGGGLLVIDTKDGGAGGLGPSPAQMREIARALNLPPLEPVSGDHVLTRAFYLLDRFPGRWRGERVWAEAAPQREAAEEALDLPQFDRVDDNVSPVVVGSADWAAAWAVDEGGRPMFPIGRPGDRQREMAVRFGVNLVMYALTGNYKSDQVHAPEVLRRLGQ